jgi:hypothetical protein
MLVSSWLIGLDTEPLHSDKVPTMRPTLQPLARAASTAKWGVSARTTQSPRGGSPAVSASVVDAITNAYAMPSILATLARKKRGRMSAMPVGDQDFGRLLALHFCPFWAEIT